MKSHNNNETQVSAAPSPSPTLTAPGFSPGAGAAVASEKANTMKVTFPTEATKVSKATALCVEFNNNNAGAIAAGLMSPIQPDDGIIKAEAEEAARVEAGFKHAQNVIAVLQMLDPKVAKEDDLVLGVRVRIESESHKSWSTGLTVYTSHKMIIGSGYGRDANKTWMKIGDGGTLGLNTKQKAKALEKLAQVKRVEENRDAHRKVEEARYAEQGANRARWKTFISEPACVDFVKRLTGSTFVAEYSPELWIGNNGLLGYKNEHFTMGQWVQIMDLRDKQAAELAALKAQLGGKVVAL